MNELDLFAAAIAITDPAERATLLDRECAGQPELRRRIEQLLEAHFRSNALLDAPEPGQTGTYTGPATGSYHPSAETAGTVIAGRYKLLQQIGEGGMGSVWMAEQTEPVKRRVAVKLIRAERGQSRTILSRFEAERQAIALMDHPHIAKLLDAGEVGQVSNLSATRRQVENLPHSSQPFFVMELVKGVPLNEYCDTHRLSIPDRLKLFMQICSAVQHAHQKGIIHRDLKPSNILVESHDGKPVPKVIDFGLAKATTGLKLTEHTLFTGFGSVLGTPMYMAPEQASFNAVDVDTRADIYALGVILYELLTGTTPLTREAIKQAQLDEMLRLIREQEAPTPSSRLSTTESKPSIAANRQMEPAKLGRFIKGELDWIVLKALAKERDRRYETANGFARDIERFLNQEPVQAGPPTAAYRFKKFVQRNKSQVVAASVVLLALVAGVIGTTLGLLRANRAAEAERQAKVREAERAEGERKSKLEAEANLAFARKGNEILASVFSGLDPKANYATVADLRNALRDNLTKAVKELEGAAIGDPLEVAAMQNALGLSLYSLGEAALAVQVHQKALATRKTHLGPEHPLTLISMSNLAVSYLAAGKLDQALPLLEKTHQLMKMKLGIDDPLTLSNMDNLASAYGIAGRLDRALELHKEALKLANAKLGPDHPFSLICMHNLAVHYQNAGQLDQALPLLEKAYQRMKAKLGADHPETLAIMDSLAVGYRDAGLLNKAFPLLEESLRLTKAKLGGDHPVTLNCIHNLAVGYQIAGQLNKALPLHQEAFALKKLKLGADHPETLRSMQDLASVYWELRQLKNSIPLFEEALQLHDRKLGRSHPNTQTLVINLGVNYKDTGRLAEAIPLLEEAFRASRQFPSLCWAASPLIDAYAQVGKHAEATAVFAEARTMLPKDSPELAFTLAQYAWGLLNLGAFAEAEPILRECLVIQEKIQPDNWRTFYVQSLLGGSLLGQKKYAEAESLLQKGYVGLNSHRQTIPPIHAHRLPAALDRLIEFYTATNKPDEVKKWQAERAKYPALKPPEKK